MVSYEAKLTVFGNKLFRAIFWGMPNEDKGNEDNGITMSYMTYTQTSSDSTFA